MLDSVACRWKALNLFMKFTFPSLSYLLLVLWSKKYFIPAWLLSAQDCHLFNYRLLSGANQHPHAKTQDCRPQTRVRRKEYQQVESQVRCPLTPFGSQARNPIKYIPYTSYLANNIICQPWSNMCIQQSVFQVIKTKRNGRCHVKSKTWPYFVTVIIECHF